jgi:hypothetical protein
VKVGRHRGSSRLVDKDVLVEPDLAAAENEGCDVSELALENEATKLRVEQPGFVAEQEARLAGPVAT